MNGIQAVRRRWREMSITTKFTSTFGVLLALILLVAVTSFVSLTLVRRETEAAILSSTEIRRLVLEMDGDLEKARRLQRDFLLQYDEIGFAEAREVYAQRAIEQLAGVVTLSEELQTAISGSDVSAALRESDVNLNLYLSTAERYADIFLELIELATTLAADGTGLEAQLAQQSASLLEILQTASDVELVSTYREMQSLEKDYRVTRQRPFMYAAFNVAFDLRQAIEAAPTLPAGQKESALAHLDDYQALAEEILQVNTTLRGKYRDFELQAQSIDPISAQLIELAKREVEHSRQRIKQTSQLATTALVVIALLGLSLAVIVARLLNRSVTHNVIKLTRAAGELQAGNLGVHTDVDSGDELGQLAHSFNAMANRINVLVNHLEEQVAARTHKLKSVATVGGRLNSILDFDELLVELVNQVKERFDYYQVQIYLLNEARDSLVLAQGYGEAGKLMKQQGAQIPLDAPRSIVAQAARERRVVLAADVHEDPHWLPSPFLPATQAELASPIVAEERVVGVLDVQADEAGVLEDSDADLLRSLANQVGVALTNARFFQQIIQANAEISTLNELLKDENMRMAAELNVTRQLQQMLLPTDEELRQVEGVDIAGFMEPADEVGGDYYDVLQHNGQLKIGMGDVTGHGLESGVVMLMIQTAVRTLLVGDERDPVRFMDVLNRVLHANMQRMDVDKCLTLALLDYQTGRLRLSGQHEQLIVVRREGQVELVDTMQLGFPVGLVEGIADFVSETSVELGPGDGVVLYSDGFTEAQNDAGEFYGLERLCQVVSGHWAGSAEDVKEAVVRDARGFIGAQTIYDDLTLLVVKQR